MTYEEIAKELLDIHAGLKRLEVNHQMDGYSRGELYALGYLYEHDGSAHPKDMSKGMMVSSARIAVILNHMEGKGWIMRTSDTTDTRQTIVNLTDAGTEMFLKEKNDIILSLAAVLKKLGQHDAEEMLRIRKKMLYRE
ncbi:MAG: MarR family transcriptional regulator [Clostridiales bacterium]|nr:MarR family transcriptional regulator [Clostridiales bacterium]